MALDLDIKATNGSSTQYTKDAIQRLVRQKLTVSVEYSESTKKMVVVLYANGTATNAENFSTTVGFSISKANSTVQVVEEGTSTINTAFNHADVTNPSAGRYEFPIAPKGKIPRITVNIEATFSNPAVDSIPAADVTLMYDYHFIAGRLTDRFDGTSFATGFSFK